MRILPHDSDGACSNGWRLGAMPKLWANGHLAHACSCRSRGAAMVTTSSRSSDIPASLATCSTIPHDGRNAACRHAAATAWHWIATKTCPRPATSHRLSQCPCHSDALVFHPGSTRSNALVRFDGCIVWILGVWTAQSVTPHSRLPHFAEHDASRPCWRWHAWHAQHPSGIIAPRQGDVPCTCFATLATAPGRRPPSTQPGHRVRARPLRRITRATSSIRAEHCQPAGATRDQFHQTRIRGHLPARVSWPRRLSVERQSSRPVPRPCGA